MQLGYLSNITSDVQSQINTINNSTTNSTYYYNSINTIISCIKNNTYNTNNYFYNSISTISSNIYFNYITKPTLSNLNYTNI